MVAFGKKMFSSISEFIIINIIEGCSMNIIYTRAHRRDLTYRKRGTTKCLRLHKYKMLGKNFLAKLFVHENRRKRIIHEICVCIIIDCVDGIEFE